MRKENKKSKIIIVSLILLIILVITILSLFLNIKSKEKVKFYLIRIEGPIMTSGDFYFYKITNADEVLKEIEKAKNYDGILLYINSNGGSASASFKILDALKEYKSMNKTIIAFIDEAGLSGAYLIASVADKIYANRISLIGSIGVIGSYLEIAGLLERYNISYVRIVKGDYKDIGSPLKHITEKEKEILEKKIEIIYNEFIEEVSKNRKLDKEEVKKIANGEFFISNEALELKLIDKIGNMKDIKNDIEKELNKSLEIIEVRKPSSFYEELKKIISFSFYAIGYGIGNSLKNYNPNIEL
ncbi:MAG: signal peptide peptidase SppA [Candidatus Pacearchaeota archaeon]